MIEVFEQSWDETNEYWSKTRRIYQSSYERIFIGDNLNDIPNAAPKGVYPGNTLLVHIHGSEYVFIGGTIYSFSVIEGDEITHYVSPLSNPNDTPAPHAIGKQRSYLMNDHYSLSMIKTDPDMEIPFIPTVIHAPNITIACTG
jgi:hypothetical protein